MTYRFNTRALVLPLLLACILSSGASAAVIVNGGFESGFSSWSRIDQAGSDGTFFQQTGTSSTSSGTAVPAPPGGTTAAMTDALAPGSHAMWQTFTIAAPVGPTMLVFDLFIGNRADAFSVPANLTTLDFSTAALNQQARVDIMPAGADPLSIAAGDILLNAFQTRPGDPLVSGYTRRFVDITSVLNANLNRPLMLRFAETDNVYLFQMGVDNVDFQAAIPEPSSWITGIGGLCALLYFRRRGR